MSSKKNKSDHSVKNSISYHKQPAEITIEQWQIALRKQFVIDKPFGIEKMDHFHIVFGDYLVRNFVTQNQYKVSIRDSYHSSNFCTCLDFKTNRLGTCKHIEAVLLTINNNPKLHKFLQDSYQPVYSSVYLSYQGKRQVKIRIGIENRKEILELASLFFDKENTLKSEAFVDFDTFLEKAYAINADFQCYPDALDYILEKREQNKRIERIESLFAHNCGTEELIKTTLFPYQQEGVFFAAKAGRSLIADEMGLGKTIQAIATAELLKNECKIASVLVICPTSLKYQWKSEIERFTNSSVDVIEGFPNIREKQYQGESFYKIVSYHTVANDVQTINLTNFDLVVLDEAQRIKNWKTKIASAVKKIITPYCVVLTGTPLENKLEELYSIIQFIDPFKLGPYYQFMNRHQIKNDTGKIVGYQHLNEIAEVLKGTVLRRTKKEVLTQLPERNDKVLFVPMTTAQRNMHDEFNGTVARLVQKWSRMGFLNEKDRQNLLIHLNLMRMVCDSTFIVDQTTRHETKIQELMCILEDYLEQTDEKVVIFSQWERMTRIVALELDKQKIKYEYLHGGVPSQKRKTLFDNFNNDSSCRIFLSTDAGSTGLNLQSASMLVNLDIPWNPAILEQRIARIHRLGQKKNVSIINFVSKDTIEERMLGLLGFKSSLAKGILDLGEDTIFMDDDKFRKFMQTVTAISDIHTPAVNDLSSEEEQEFSTFSENGIKTEDELPLLPEDEYIPDDDDVKLADSTAEDLTTAPEIDPSQLLTQGITFLSGLSKTLASPQKTAELVNSITEKDETTGKTYLKIPVEDEQVVANVLKMVGQLFRTN